jgi:hypothetical protein
MAQEFLTGRDSQISYHQVIFAALAWLFRICNPKVDSSWILNPVEQFEISITLFQFSVIQHLRNNLLPNYTYIVQHYQHTLL